MDRRGSSCPTLFAWDGEKYQLVADMLGDGVVGHWVGPGQRNIPRPTEYVKIDRNMLHEKDDSRSEEHTSELQSQSNLVCRLLLEKKKKKDYRIRLTYYQ